MLAIPVWRERVSTVCDFSRRALLIDVRGNREISRREVSLPEEPAVHRAARLAALDVQVLVCGAISRPLAWFVSQAGIRILPFVSGPVDEVLAAYLCGRLADPRYLMPGSPPAAGRRLHGEGR
jgi:predicted Fe-Mo cluster-binding NifX family protein